MSTNENLQISETVVLPALALRGLVIFPGMLLQFDVGRKKSVLALNKAMDENQLIFLVAQKDLTDSEPDGDQIYRMGVAPSWGKSRFSPWIFSASKRFPTARRTGRRR